MLKFISKGLCVIVTLFTISACEDNMLQRNAQSPDGKTFGGDGGRPGGFKQNPGESYPFPEIIETEFIPRYDLFEEFKCLTWKITWPEYDGDYSSQYIPTVLSLNNGELNSFNFLNNTDPENTFNSTMSLYYSQKVATTITMWDELDYTFGLEDSPEMETVFFAKSDYSLETIMVWVTKRPQLFENHWPNGFDTELDYSEGDIIQFQLSEAKLYGGIRIVSMTPRIIEVYLAVPN